MSGDIIKSFLVGLGFDVDDSSLGKFNNAITSATVKVTALFASVDAAATGIVYGISNISDSFEKMGYEYRIIAPAINKALVLRNELFKAYDAAGINIQKVVLASVKLNLSLAKTKFAFDAIYKSVGSRFFGLLTKQSDIFRKKIYDNMPKIQEALETFVKFIFKAFDLVTQLGVRLWSILTRVYDFFAQLHKATSGWSAVILGVVAAWEALNLSFLATPLGELILSLTTLLALYDDFATFQEGGKSLFDWGPVLPFLREVIYEVKFLLNLLDGAAKVIDQLFYSIGSLFTGQFSTALTNLKELGAVLSGDRLLFQNEKPNISQNLSDISKLGAPTQSYANSTSNSNVNQHVSFHDTYNISGSADASSVGRSIAGQQKDVQYDIMQNLVGGTR